MEPKNKTKKMFELGGGWGSDATGAVLSTLWSWSAACHLVFLCIYFSFGDSHLFGATVSPTLNEGEIDITGPLFCV